ncbi:MAG: MmcQ/YjbR family DNA-binding protein [Pseudobdellovibrionaceae bacterium]
MKKLSTRQVCEMARVFEGVTEKDHFGSDAFVANGRIFATVWHDKNEVNLMLNEKQQKAFLVRDDSEGFNVIENSWGKNAINVQLECIDAKVFTEALKEAWLNSKNKRAFSQSPNKKPSKKTSSKKKPKSKR